MVAKTTVNLVTNQQLATFYNSTATAWFAAGVIAPLFTTTNLTFIHILRGILGIGTTIMSLKIATSYSLKTIKRGKHE